MFSHKLHKVVINRILGICGFELIGGHIFRRTAVLSTSTGQRQLKRLAGVEEFVNRCDELVLVLQMGAVGSLSIVKLLKDNGVASFHVHSLNNFSGTRSRSSVDGFLRYLLFEGKESEECLAKPTKIITGYREPISYLISFYFKDYYRGGLKEIIERKFGTSDLTSIKRHFLECADVYVQTFLDEIDIGSKNQEWPWEHIDGDEYIKRFVMRCYLPSLWFDLELKELFGFDIYSKTLDRSRGCSIYREDDLEVLVLDSEKLTEIGPKQIGDFLNNLGVAGATMPRINIRSQNVYGDLYSEFLSSIVLPKEFVDQQYSSKYAKYFYSEEDLKQFKNRWIGENGSRG